MTSKTGIKRPAALNTARPVVGVVCDLKLMGPHRMHAAGEKYLAAVSEFAGAAPLLIPVLDSAADVTALLDAVDGLLLPGSPSNVEPARYGGESPREGTLLDPARDALSLDLIRAALAREKPLMAICRGFQELNVALGGTLHQHLHEVESGPGYAPRMDHREDTDAPLDVQYGPAHDVACTKGGLLAGVIGSAPVAVNSLHGQGVDRKAARLRIEARAPDGTIEAAVVQDAPALALGVQWHPEWQPDASPHNAALLAAFGSALASPAGPPLRVAR
ncbi:MAG: gamma-glutamyl-gamma-aminobutyrate hydrolase family protein [Alphaproteobacteria bacterium]